MDSLDLLAAAAAALALLWLALGAWVLGERSAFDRARSRAARDAEELEAGGDPRRLSRRRLRGVALGPAGTPATSAAAELVRRDGRRLRRAGARADVRALTILSRGGDPAVGALIRAAIASGDAVAAAGRLRLTAELPEGEADQLLVELLAAGQLSRSRVATELEPRTARLQAELVELMSADDPELRFWSVTLLGRAIDRAPVFQAVRARAGDKSPSVRAAVADALGFAPPGSSRDLLRPLLSDETFYVRSHAARAVAQSRDTELADDLLPLLADESWWVRAAAKESLGALGERGLEVASRALAHPDRFARDSALEILAGAGRLVDLGGGGEVLSPELPTAETA